MSCVSFLAYSDRGQPHSTTLAHSLTRASVREVLECGCPLSLSSSAAKSVQHIQSHRISLRLPAFIHHVVNLGRDHVQGAEFVFGQHRSAAVRTVVAQHQWPVLWDDGVGWREW